MTITNYFPPWVFRSLLDMAGDQNLSIKEVELILLRRSFRELGIQCKHRNIKCSKSKGLPYCSDCYQRMEFDVPPSYSYNGKLLKQPTYKEIPDFIKLSEINK